MNVVLRCNRHEGDQVCRRELRHEAYVTTCSHIFCRECVQEQRFTDPARGRRQCLACETALPAAEDVVRTNLRPKEDYLSTLLCGLDPPTIMDCANKAVTFWNYQMYTEIVWQEHIVERWMKRYNALRSNASKVIGEANGEIADLQQQVNTLIREKGGFQRRADDLAEKLEERTTAQDKLQTLYGNLKLKVQTDQARNAVTNVEAVAQPIDIARSHQSVNDPQFDTASLPPLLTSRKHPQNHHKHSVDEHGVEILHPFQRSGSARGQTSSEIAAANAKHMMPPPMNFNGKDTQYRASIGATPAQSVPLSRAKRNNTFPQASANRQSVSQHFPIQSVDRRAAQSRPRYQSQFQPHNAGQGLSTPGTRKMAANRNIY